MVGFEGKGLRSLPLDSIHSLSTQDQSEMKGLKSKKVIFEGKSPIK